MHLVYRAAAGSAATEVFVLPLATTTDRGATRTGGRRGGGDGVEFGECAADRLGDRPTPGQPACGRLPPPTFVWAGWIVATRAVRTARRGGEEEAKRRKEEQRLGQGREGWRERQTTGARTSSFSFRSLSLVRARVNRRDCGEQKQKKQNGKDPTQQTRDTEIARVGPLFVFRLSLFVHWVRSPRTGGRPLCHFPFLPISPLWLCSGCESNGCSCWLTQSTHRSMHPQTVLNLEEKETLIKCLLSKSMKLKKKKGETPTRMGDMILHKVLQEQEARGRHWDKRLVEAVRFHSTPPLHVSFPRHTVELTSIVFPPSPPQPGVDLFFPRNAAKARPNPNPSHCAPVAAAMASASSISTK